VADTRDYYIRIYAENGTYLTSLGAVRTPMLQELRGAGGRRLPRDRRHDYAYISDYWSCTVTVWNASDNPPQYAGQISNLCNNFGSRSTRRPATST